MPDASARHLTPEAAVDRLEELHAAAAAALRRALARFVGGGPPPDAAERAAFRYPELRVDWEPRGGAAAAPFTRRAWARLAVPGAYATTVTQPAHFRPYLLEQLRPLAAEYGAAISVGPGGQEMPYPFALEDGDELDLGGGASAAALARHFPTPMLAAVGDEVADGTWEFGAGRPRPLALFDAGGLRASQRIGDYVLAHGYLRRDRILDDLVPPEVPVPALAEVQVALQEAAARVTGDRG
jgi:AMP nucleosidase